MAGSGGSSGPLWLIWIGLGLAGFLLLADAFTIYHLTKWTARIGLALLWSAVALLAGKGRWAGNVSTIIVWLGVVLCYIL